MSDSDDEDTRRAIALSLQDDSSPPTKLTPAAIIDLTSSDDDDDLDAPVHIKGPTPSDKPPQKPDRHTRVVDESENDPKLIPIKDEGLKKGLPSPMTESPQIVENSSESLPPSVGSAMLGLDRRRMEAERLARAQQKKQREEELLVSELNESRKRKASISAILPRSQDDRQVKAKFWEPTQPTKKDIGDPTVQSARTLGYEIKSDGLITQDPRSLAIGDPFSAPSKSSKPANLPLRETTSGIDALWSSKPTAQPTPSNVLSFNQQKALKASGIQYPDGVVKRTWVKGCPREDDVTIEEVFQKDDLELAVLSTFQVEPDWVSTKMLEKTKVVWVLQAKDENEVSSNTPCFAMVTSLR